jgi:hypothetical protein
MTVDHRLRVFCLVASAVLLACAKDHSDALPTGDAAGSLAGAAADGGKAGTGGKTGSATPPALQPKRGKSGIPGAKAVATFKPLGDTTTTALGGTATFSASESGVDVAIRLMQCPRSGAVDLFIQDGSDCSDATITGPHWDSPRGEGLPKITCIGVSGIGRGAYTRASDDKHPWSIDGSTASNVVNHAIVAYDSASGAPLACGVIGVDENAPPPTLIDPAAVSDIPVAGKAVIAGLCFGGLFARDNEQECPNPKELTACAQEHCQLDACVAQCRSFLECTTQSDDVCDNALTCELDAACSGCLNDTQSCAVSFCIDKLACASPIAPDGPCAKLVACCNLQGDFAETCLETVHQIERLSGDPSCYGVMQDWDSVSHLPVPCTFE